MAIKNKVPSQASSGADTFSDDLVGLQITNGSSQLTNTNFEIDRSIPEKDSKNFRSEPFSEFLTLDDLKEEVYNGLTTENKILDNNEIKFKNSKENGSVSLFGSLKLRLGVTVSNLIKKFPAGVYVDAKTPSRSSNYTATNIIYDEVTNTTVFNIQLSMLYNPLDITFISPSSYIIPETYNEIRNFFSSYTKYVVDIKNKTYDILYYEEPSDGRNLIKLRVLGDCFNEISNFSESFLIRPNNGYLEEFFKSLDDLESILLNRETSPKYTSTFTIIDEENNPYNKTVSWPISYDGWNILTNGLNYNLYINTLYEIGDNIDEYKSNLIIRYLTSPQLFEFDTLDRKIESIFQVYGQSFDKTKKYIDNIEFMRNVTYDGINNIPDSLLKGLSETLGLSAFRLYDESKINEIFYDRNDSSYEGISVGLNIHESEIEIYRRLLNNLIYLYKSKGTRNTLEFLLKFLGAPDPMIIINEFIYIVDGFLPSTNVERDIAEVISGNKKINIAVNSDDDLRYTQLSLNQYSSLHRDQYPVDEITGLPRKYESIDGSVFFQSGAGWHTNTIDHRSSDILDTKNSDLVSRIKTIKTMPKPFTYGEDYFNEFRRLPGLNYGYTLISSIDNKKTQNIDNDSESKRIMNRKNIEVFLSGSKAIDYDAYKYIGVDGQTFDEFNNKFFNNYVSNTSRIRFEKSYPEINSVYSDYLNNKENPYTHDIVNGYINKITPYWLDIVEQFIPATTLWSGGNLIENSLFERSKYQNKINRINNVPVENLFTPLAISVFAETYLITSGKITFTGDVLDEGSSTVTMRGVCYSDTNSNPTIDDKYITTTGRTGQYKIDINGLVGDVRRYNLRAFAKNKVGISYGDVINARDMFNLNISVTKTSTTNINNNDGTITVTVLNGSPNYSYKLHIGTNYGSIRTISLIPNKSCTFTNLEGGLTYKVDAFSNNDNYSVSQYVYLEKFQEYAPTLLTQPLYKIYPYRMSYTMSIINGTDQITSYGICWSTLPNPTVNNSVSSGSSGYLISLTPNTIYYARSFAISESNTTYYGNQVSAKTIETYVRTEDPYGVSNRNAILLGTSLVDYNDPNIKILEYGFLTGDTSTTQTNKLIVGSNPNYLSSFNLLLSNLINNKTYYYRAYIILSDIGQVEGYVKSFYSTTATTINVPPTVSTIESYNIKSTSIDCGGIITSGSSPLICGLCWSVLNYPSVNVDLSSQSILTSGSSNYLINSSTHTLGSFTNTINGLTPNTTYYIRAFAFNAYGLNYGIPKAVTTISTNDETIVWTLLSNPDGLSVLYENTVHSTFTKDGFISTKEITAANSGSSEITSIPIDGGMINLGTTWSIHGKSNELSILRNGVVHSVFNSDGFYSTGVVSTHKLNIGVTIDPTDVNYFSIESNTVNGNLSSSGVTLNLGNGWTIAGNENVLLILSGNTIHSVFDNNGFYTIKMNSTYGYDGSTTTVEVMTSPLTQVYYDRMHYGVSTTLDPGMISEIGVCWSTTTNPTINNLRTYGKTYNGWITNLNGDTTYYVRGFVKSVTGDIYYGMNVSKKTLPYNILTNTETNINGTSVTLNGYTPIDNTDTNINIISYGFKTGVTINPTDVIVIGSNVGHASSIGSFSKNLTGLTPSNNYYYQAFINIEGLGEFVGIVREVTTLTITTFDLGNNWWLSGGTNELYVMYNTSIQSKFDSNGFYSVGSVTGYEVLNNNIGVTTSVGDGWVLSTSSNNLSILSGSNINSLFNTIGFHSTGEIKCYDLTLGNMLVDDIVSSQIYKLGGKWSVIGYGNKLVVVYDTTIHSVFDSTGFRTKDDVIASIINNV